MQDEQPTMQDEQTKTKSRLARKVLPILVLLLLIALALNHGTLRDLVTKPAPRGAGAPQEASRSLSSPDETKKVLANLGLQWGNPGPPVLVFTKPG